MSTASAYSHDSIAMIRKAVADYHIGLDRIDREFKEACDQLEQSICSLDGDLAEKGKSATNVQEQGNLFRQKASKIGQEITKTEEEINRANQGVAAVESEIRSIAQEKSGLDQQIGNRQLLEKIYLFFAEDKAKHRCQVLARELDSAKDKKRTLERTKIEFEHKRNQAEARKSELEENLKQVRQKLASLERSKGLTEEKSKQLEEERKRAENNRQKRSANWFARFAADWEKMALQIEHVGAQVRKLQPAFVDLHPSPPPATEVPTALLLGEQKVSFSGLSCLMTHSIPFPFTSALVLPEENAAQLRLAHHILLRLLSALPPGLLEMTVIDPRKQGQSFEPFRSLQKVEQLVPQQRWLTSSEEIEQSLNRLATEVEDLVQRRFTEKETAWLQFNAKHTENPLPYRVVLLFNVPAQLSGRSLWLLERLCENGPRCGILPILAIDGSHVGDRRFENFRMAMAKTSVRLDSLPHSPEDGRDGLSFIYQPEQWPDSATLENIISVYAERCAAKARFSKSMPDLWNNFAKGATTIDGFDIPIGWTPAGENVSLSLGATGSEHHALLAGKTGSGKSNLLHVIIHSLSEKYSPIEVDLYLLDYKQSIEFSVYANPSLPHARLVATESDTEFGVTILKHLTKEMEIRKRIFDTEGARDFAQYRNESHEHLPRILLVIDEFQVLFSDSRQVSEASEQLLSQLLKQGRSFGIHILLATQTLKGINTISIGAIISQMGCRIALACGQEDSAMILSSNNWEASELRSPPEGIINNASGAKSGNVKFLIPLAENAFCKKHIAKLSERAVKRKLHGKTRVFNGANLPSHPAPEQYLSGPEQANTLILGETLTFTTNELRIPLIARNAFNFLLCGYNDLIHDGLLVSIFRSLAVTDAFDEIIYFNGRGIAETGCSKHAAQILGSRLAAFEDADTLPLQKIQDNIGKCRTALIVDGLDSERSFHPAMVFKAPKPGEPIPPADLLKRIADEGPRKGTFVFAFVENWRLCASPCRDLFSLFELRVAFCMNEDDAGALVSGNIGKFKGIEKPNRAVFINRMTNETTWFRPYIQETPQ